MRDASLDLEFFRRAPPVLTTSEDGMCFVDENTRALGFGDVDQLLKVSEVAIHRVNAFDHDQQGVFPCCEPTTLSTRRDHYAGIFPIGSERESRHRADDVRAVVEHRDIGFAKQAGDDAEGAAESTVKEHGIFSAEKLRELALKLAVQIGHAGKHREPQCQPIGTR